VLLNSFFDRAAGYHGGMEQTMRWVATQAGASPTDQQIQRACALRRQTERELITFRSDAQRLLATLRACGIRTAVVSDCTHEVPELWPSLSLAPYVDATVFSIWLGTCKPHEDMYVTAARALGVHPRECLYVGDGGSQELSGAAAVGMRPVMLRAPDSAEHAAHDQEVDWAGPQITALEQVLDLINVSDHRLQPVGRRTSPIRRVRC